MVAVLGKDMHRWPGLGSDWLAVFVGQVVIRMQHAFHLPSDAVALFVRTSCLYDHVSDCCHP